MGDCGDGGAEVEGWMMGDDGGRGVDVSEGFCFSGYGGLWLEKWFFGDYIYLV